MLEKTCRATELRFSRQKNCKELVPCYSATEAKCLQGRIPKYGKFKTQGLREKHQTKC